MRARSALAALLLALLLAPGLPQSGGGAPAGAGGDGGGGDGTARAASVPLYMRAGTFDPVLDAPPGPAALQQPSTAPYHVVQFDGPIQRAWREDLAALGVSTVAYLPDWAYVACVPSGRAGEVEALPHVRYVGPAHPAYRLHPDLWGEACAGPIRDLSISTWEAGGGAAVADRIARAGGTVDSVDGRLVVASARVADAVATLMEARLGVAWVEIAWSATPINDNDAHIAKARQQDDGAYDAAGAALWSYDTARDAFEGYPGRNVTIAVADTGLDDTHPAFSGRIVQYYDYGNDGMKDDNGHGTHVSGTALGDGSWRAGDPGQEAKYAGLAPQAGLVMQEMFNNPNPPSVYGRDASASGATISSNSWVGGVYGDYNGYCQEYDAMTRDANAVKAGDQPVFYVFGAGNDGWYGAGTIMPPSLAKNVLSVGSVGDDRWGASSDTISGFSSRGPTADGRIKPDVLMPGDIIASARSLDNGASSGWGKPVDGGDSYVFASGTSMATPGAAGAAAVATQYLKDVNGITPSPALLKAALINGATPLPGLAYPSMDQGWGRIDLDRSLIERADHRIYRVDQEVGLDTGAGTREKLYWFMVSRGSPLKVTLVWTDVAGAPSSTKNLVNDLDLELVSPEGFRYSGNDFLGSQSRINMTGNPDRTNNVEGFYLEAPADGLWQVWVRAYSVPEGAQDFALVVSGDVRKGHIDLVPSHIAAEPATAEEGSPVHLTASVANEGNRDAAGVGWAFERVDPDLRTEVLAQGELGDLPSGATRTVELNVTGTRGYHTFRLRADPARRVLESNESNNAAELVCFFRGYDVTLAAERTLARANPSAIVDFPLVVTNRGNVEDVVHMVASEPPPGWAVDLTAYRTPLGPDEAMGISLQVVVPANATAGETVTLTVDAASEGNTSRHRAVSVQVVVNQVYGLELSAVTPPQQQVLPGQSVPLDLLVRNTGNGPDIITLAATRPGGGWSVGLSVTVLTVPLRTDEHVTVELIAPDPAVVGTSAAVDVTASSSLPGLTRDASFSAVVVQFYRSEVDFVAFVGEGDAGDRVVIPLAVKNRGNGPVQYSGDIALPDESWKGALELDRLDLGAYSSARANLTFTVPQDAVNASYDFAMVVISSGGEIFYNNFSFTVHQWHNLGVRVPSPPAPVTQGSRVHVRLSLINYGNGLEDSRLSLVGAATAWTWHLSDARPQVGAFMTAYVELDIDTSKLTDGGLYELRAVCQYGGAPVKEAVARFTLTVLTRPDLSVYPGDVNVTPPRPLVKSTARVVVTVHNLGQTVALEVYVQLFAEGVPVGQPQWVGSLDPGEEESFTFLWTVNASGARTLRAVVDGLSTVDEYDEGDNEAMVLVDVRKPPEPARTWPVLAVGLIAIAALVGAAAWERWRRPPDLEAL